MPQFLTGLNLMDYSLLVGIHDSRQAPSTGGDPPPLTGGDPHTGRGGDPFDSEDNGLDDEESETEPPNELGGARGVYGSSPPAYSPRRGSSSDRVEGRGAGGARETGGGAGGGAGCVKIDHSVEVYAIRSTQRKCIIFICCRLFFLFSSLFCCRTKPCTYTF